MKKLTTASLFGLLIAFTANAQTAPNASVDNEGNLVLEGGEVVQKPAGTVTQDGDLNVGGTIIQAPNATVNQDGSLTVGGQTYQIPSLPVGGDFIIDWFGDDMLFWENQYYWNFKFKFLYHLVDNNWFWSDEFNAWMYVLPDGSSPDTGFWAYFINLFDGTPANVPAQSQGIWAYMWTSTQADYFNDLRDQNLDGINEIQPGDTGNYKMDGWLWVLDANGYDSEGEGLFWFSEYESKYGDSGEEGNFMTRVWSASGNPSPYWMKLTNPI